MLLGRDRGCGRIRRLLEDARAGRSGVLVLRGEAGIGKSALCDFAREQAGGMIVVRARGVESESTLAFSALGDLFRPVLGRLEAIPEPQAAALAGALAIGPAASRDPYTVCAATLSLLGAVAEGSPVLAVVDSAQWLDGSSAEALLFAARRLDYEGVALLVAARSGERSVFDDSGLPELTLGGLGDDEARKLLASVDGSIAPPVVERLLGTAAGNPLALLELAHSLSAEERTGAAALPSALPPGPAIERAFLRRVRALPDDTQRALLVAAASETGETQTILRAVVALGVADGRGALEAAEAAGLLTMNGELEFRNPLLRSSLYHGASPASRRAAHEALAAAAADDRRAWHLAAAAPAEDEDVAAGLERAARGAWERGGLAEAASAFERAARLSSSEADRARRLREAANALRLAGQADRAVELLDESLASAREPLLQADIQHLRGRVELWRGGGRTAHDLLVSEAGRIESLDPAKAAVMLTDAVMLAVVRGDLHAALETAQRASAAGERAGGAIGSLSAVVLDAVLMVRGATDSSGLRELLLGLAAGQDDALPAHQLTMFAGTALIWLEEYEHARRLLGRIVERARAAGAPGELPYVLACLSELDFRTGRWPAAYAGAAESVQLAGETRQTGALPYSLACLGRVEAGQGREGECRTHLERALALSRASGTVPFELFARSALGLLELGLAEPEAAIGELEPAARALAGLGLGEPAAVQWAPDLIEAYVRCGRRADAEEALAGFAGQAQATGRSWALAAAARCRGLLADDADFEAAFEEALEWHARTPTPFERARTELCFGERLRRARRRIDARERLRSALQTFERLGAVPWIDRARTELNASGETLGRRDDLPLQELTAQELQVALLVAQGSTNREVGAALFLSPKTIEAHLGRIYRKLGIRSRTELAHLLAGEGTLVGAA